MNYLQAVETLDRLAVQLAGLTEAAAMLREIGSYEGMIAAQRETLRVVEAQAAEARLTVAQCTAEAEAARVEGRQRVDAASVEASRIVREANATAESIVAAARTAAEIRVADALDSKKRTLAKAEHEIQALTQERDELTRLRESLRAEIAELGAQRTQAQAGLEDVRARLRQLMGGGAEA